MRIYKPIFYIFSYGSYLSNWVCISSYFKASKDYSTHHNQERRSCFRKKFQVIDYYGFNCFLWLIIFIYEQHFNHLNTLHRNLVLFIVRIRLSAVNFWEEISNRTQCPLFIFISNFRAKKKKVF